MLGGVLIFSTGLVSFAWTFVGGFFFGGSPKLFEAVLFRFGFRCFGESYGKPGSFLLGFGRWALWTIFGWVPGFSVIGPRIRVMDGIFKLVFVWDVFLRFCFRW